MRHLEEIRATPVINYSNPLSNDYMGLHYQAIETCYDYSYGQFYTRYDKTPVKIYATRFEGIITPILTIEKADKAYRDKLNSILEIIRNQEDTPF